MREISLKMKRKTYYIYILTNKYHSVYYTGVTNNLVRRIYEHKNHLVKGFTNKYNIDKLIYFEETNNIETSILREKQIKDYRREKKIDLIKKITPKMKDLYYDLI